MFIALLRTIVKVSRVAGSPFCLADRNSKSGHLCHGRQREREIAGKS